MKFVLSAISVLVSLSCTNALQESADIYYHEKQAIGASMWHFSPDGLTIYATDGESVIKKHRKNPLCGETEEDTCSWFDIRSDGLKYVWAASFSGGSAIHMFDIDTGDYVGYQPTCSTPLDLEYHSSRREMWVRCASEGTKAGAIDVFSSDSISTDHSEILIQNITSGRQYGRMATHPAMQGKAYATTYNENDIAEVDISSRMEVAKHEIEQANGAYDMTYSPVNEHLYVRTRICCSCGFEGAELPECRSAGQVLVQLGPNAGTEMQNGTCGTSCKGTAADTITIAEFDTVSKSIISYHNIKTESGFGAEPISSPNGEYILLLPYDGGQYVRVMAPGANGASSSVAMDIPVDFKGGVAGKMVVTDVAFVNDANRNIMVIAAASDNDIVLVDVNDNYRMVKLSLTAAEESTETSSRRVEWAVGTDYVWISGGEALEVYVIDLGNGIDDSKVALQKPDVTSGEYLFVNNYERIASAQASVSAQALANNDEKDDDDEWVKGVAVAALVVASMALLFTMVLLFANLSGNAPAASAPTPARPETAIDDEEKSLGSKLVA